MSKLNPYPADPYRQGVAGTPYPSDSDVAVQSASGVSSAQNGYYSADGLGDQAPAFPAAPGGQMVPYPGIGQQPYSHAYGQPYSQQYPYPSPSYVPYPPYGQGVYWGVLYDPRRHEANALGGWALGLGIASIFANCLYFGLFLGVPAIIVGVMGMRAADEGRASNKGLSIAGVVTGAIGSVIGAGFLLLLLVIILQ
ncbi:DUF4190 domain-containing protein [Actinomyces oris]|uniref:DUF4190 domain-containing protein n=1 Tax=Actinomyces oris TaxID=544580 RepID=UPI0028E91918|nr:DUF4190 domain-containing protein [Actinomyces oris]